MKITGVVESIPQFAGKFGLMYSVRVNGQNYGCKGQKPKADPGDTVEFEANQNGHYWDVVGAIRKLDVPNVPQAVRGTGASTGGGGGKNWMDDEKKQGIITRQGASNTATNLMTLAATLDILPLPKTGKDRFDAFLSIHKKLTDQLNDYCNPEGIGSAVPKEQAEAIASVTAAAAEADAGW